MDKKTIYTALEVSKIIKKRVKFVRECMTDGRLSYLQRGTHRLVSYNSLIDFIEWIKQEEIRTKPHESHDYITFNNHYRTCLTCRKEFTEQYFYKYSSGKRSSRCLGCHLHFLKRLRESGELLKIKEEKDNKNAIISYN